MEKKLLLVLIVAILGLAWTTTIDSKTEYGYLKCKNGFDCHIKEKVQKPAKPVKPVKHKKVKQND